MPASEPKTSEPKKLPGIFISYRRSDNPDAVGRIYDRLVSEFGKARVFKDVDSIPLGQDFRGHLNDIIGGCVAALAVIGPKWTDIRNEAGHKRLEDPDDFVRIELEAALARDVPVVPVLVGHAPMPGTSQLPSTLSSLAFRQSIEVRPDPDFHNDATRLVSALKAIIDPNAPREPPEGATGVAARQATSDSAPKHWRRFAWVIALAGVVVPLVATFGSSVFRQMRAPPPQELRLDIVTPPTDDPGSFALSPDGKQIVFVAKSDGVQHLWLRSLAKATAQLLAGTEGASSPFWSPDSRSIAFYVPGTLKRLDLEGGQPQALAPASGSIGGSWSSNGVILFSTHIANPISRVSATGGSTTAIPLLGKGALGNVGPLFLPDGQRFLFVSIATGVDGGIYLGSLDGSTPVQLTTDAGVHAYLPSGWLLRIRQGGALVAQRLDLDKRALVGESVTLADGVQYMSVSATGLVAYRVGAGGMRQLTWVDRSGTARGTVGAPDGSLNAPRVSPDGRQVAFSRETQRKSDIWVHDDARTSRVTFGSEGSRFPVWSPDGSRVVFLSGLGLGDFYQKLTNGAQAQELLLKSDKVTFPTSWSADGKYLLYFSFEGGPAGDLWVLSMTGDRKPFPFLKTLFTEVWGQFSPDGKWVAYESNESGPTEVYVRRFVVPGSADDDKPVQAGQWQVSTSGGVFPTWSADGKELFYIDPAGMMMAAPIAHAGSTVVPGTPVTLFRAQVLGGGTDSAQGRQYDVAPDGRFIINRVLDTATAPITLIQNWNPDAGN